MIFFKFFPKKSRKNKPPELPRKQVFSTNIRKHSTFFSNLSDNRPLRISPAHSYDNDNRFLKFSIVILDSHISNLVHFFEKSALRLCETASLPAARLRDSLKCDIYLQARMKTKSRIHEFLTLFQKTAEYCVYFHTCTFAHHLTRN